MSSSPSTLPPTACDSMGFDAVRALHLDLVKMNRTSERPLIVGAGEGTSGTSSLAEVMRNNFGLNVLHSGLSPTNILARIDPQAYAKIDFVKLLKAFDAVLDTPIPQFFPFILAAFPNARVVHTLRDPRQWVVRRSQYVPTPKPMAALLAKLNTMPPYPSTWETEGRFWTQRRPVNPILGMHASRHVAEQDHAMAILYSAQNAYYRCITPSEQYLPLHVLERETCRSTFLSNFSMFIRRPVTNWTVPIAGCEQSKESASHLHPPKSVRWHRSHLSPGLGGDGLK